MTESIIYWIDFDNQKDRKKKGKDHNTRSNGIILQLQKINMGYSLQLPFD